MMYAGRAVLAVVLVAVSVVAKPNHLKAVVDTDPVPVHVVKEIVPVVKEIVPVVKERATPGYSVQAGAGGSGVYAAADSSHGSASTGGSGSVGHKPIHTGPGFFDNIFNIPISVLKSVNTYLNNRGPITKPVHRRRGQQHPVEQSPHTGDVPSEASSSASASASASADSEANSGAGGAGAHPTQNHGPIVIQKKVNYDEIFNHETLWEYTITSARAVANLHRLPSNLAHTFRSAIARLGMVKEVKRPEGNEGGRRPIWKESETA